MEITLEQPGGSSLAAGGEGKPVTSQNSNVGLFHIPESRVCQHHQGTVGMSHLGSVPEVPFPEGLGLTRMEAPWLGLGLSGSSPDCGIQWGFMPGSS